MDGAAEIQQLMSDFRSNPPKSIAGSKVICIHDYSTSTTTDKISGKETKIDLPKSNVLQYITEDGTKISVRPSGTEPKIKFYFSVQSKLDRTEDFDTAYASLGDKINMIIAELGLA